MTSGRTFISTALTCVAFGSAWKAFAADDAIEHQFASIESETGGRLGVAILDTASGTHYAYRANERFPMCSTFKFLLAAAILERQDRAEESLDRRIAFTKDDVVANSPVSGPRAGGAGMTVAELCEAAITRSDNTAANLLLASIGGPTALTAFARQIGDRTTRLDRIEPALNEAIDGDLRDTTTPSAMLTDMREILLSQRLSSSSRDRLVAWLVANQTGGTRLRAGLPSNWRIGDKTGTGEQGTANDIAIVWPTGRAPILVAAYLTQAVHAAPAQRDAAFRQIGALAAAL
ncbi:Beta-lactamase [Candidatus Burkholderia verschuerenii]|uniref:Beta-lactamase n=1 Tax=Candidatus Burkholderia verschuerenii TaxID=242163 RepID=A0A0L0MG07_9BURK|nr:class A beta-lactamase [Candidatus Burkholderia verschuerenii]KND61607.1 Beta-lactamase [Candidatus Burkholderia verschuerenii]